MNNNFFSEDATLLDVLKSQLNKSRKKPGKSKYSYMSSE